MKKFAFIGAGSYVFTRELVRDLLTYSSFQDCEIALMDTDAERLEVIKKAVDRIITFGNYPAKVLATMDRVEALKGADGVICTIKVGGLKAIKNDIEIPKKYGVDINIGDTIGPAGIFRALRTIPVMLDICRDIESYCPNAVFLNYTNPMSMLCKAMQSTTNVKVVGLCHSVQDCAAQIAGWIGADVDEISYICAGINHQAWYLTFNWKGKDAYPLIMKSMRNPEIFNQEQVRNEMLLKLGYCVTESSGHNSEYNSWFRKRPDLIERYCTYGTGNNPGLYGMGMREKNWKEEINEWSEKETVDLKRGNEYAASIFNAILGDGELFKFNGNIMNRGYIENLPLDSCVEVPILASKLGLEPIYVGALPPQLAILNSINAQCHDLAVEGALTGDPRKVYYAICYDPLTSAVLSLDEIQQMVDEMFEASKQWLPQFKFSN
jgi:alpha-galactosidase